MFRPNPGGLRGRKLSVSVHRVSSRLAGKVGYSRPMTFVYFLELLGTAAFAVTGALAASRKGMDIFGFIVLALMPAIGGGTVRDVIIDRTPVFWIADNRYIVVAIIAALVVFFTRWKPGSRRRLLVWMDAMGLALFAALGTQISLAHDTGPLVAVLLGVSTAVTGGMIRDVICNEIPLVLSARNLRDGRVRSQPDLRCRNALYSR